MPCSWSARSVLSSFGVSSCRCEGGSGIYSQFSPEVAVELPQRPLEVREPAGAAHARPDGALHRGAGVDVFAVDVADRLDQLAAAFLDPWRGQRGRGHADVELELALARPERQCLEP